MFSQKLGTPVDTGKIERGHHIGIFRLDRCRPIAAKFSFFKDRGSLLASRYKLKGNGLAVGENSSKSVQPVRRKLRVCQSTGISVQAASG